MKALISVLIAGILMMYPFAVYYGLQYFPPRFLALILLALLFVRIVLLKNNLAKMPWVVPATLLGSLALVFSFFTQSNLGFIRELFIVYGFFFFSFQTSKCH